MLRWLLPLIAFVGVTHLAAESKAAPPLTGLYGNVRMSPQTGDLGGQEIRFFADPQSGQPMVEFVDCEGWCNATYIAPLNDGGSHYWFEYKEKYYDGEDNVVEEGRRRYQLTFRGKTLILSGSFPDCTECTSMGPYRLKRLKSSFGIAVANNEP
jgi:hypothetical protein